MNRHMEYRYLYLFITEIENTKSAIAYICTEIQSANGVNDFCSSSQVFGII